MGNSMDDPLSRTFLALADPTRRAILAQIADGALSVNDIVAANTLSQPGISKHLKVLEDAGLVIAERRGRERWNHLNAMPIQDIHDRWIGPHAAAASARLARFKLAVESK